MIACYAPHVPRTLTENINYYTIPPSFPVVKLQNGGFKKKLHCWRPGPNKETLCRSKRPSLSEMDNRLAACSSSFRASRRQNSFYSPLVNLDHVTYTCPTGLTGLAVQSRTHCLHGMDSYNCCPKNKKTTTLNTSHRQSSHLTQVDVTAVLSHSSNLS